MTADALGGHGAHQLVDLLLGADVEAARRMVEDQDPRACAFSHLASTTFCWLPPDRLRHSVSMPGVRMRSRSTQLRGQPPLRAGVDQAVPASARRGSASVMLAATGRNSTSPSTRRSRGM